MGAEKEIAINPAIWSLGDLTEYQAKMQTGIDNLADIHDCDVAIGETAKDAVFSIEKVTLYKYRPLDSNGTGDETLTHEPILIAYSLFGRYSMLDLQSDRSVVRKLLALGHTVYIIDWGNPNRSDRWLSYDDYVGRYMSDCVDFIRHQQNIERLTLFGICEGGTFAACYASLFPEKLGALVLAVTPIDFHADLDAAEPRKRGYLGGMMRQLSPSQITDLIDSFGCLPGHLSGTVFREMTLLDTCKLVGPHFGAAAEDGDVEVLAVVVARAVVVAVGPITTYINLEVATEFSVFFHQECLLQVWLHAESQVDVDDTVVLFLSEFAFSRGFFVAGVEVGP